MAKKRKKTDKWVVELWEYERGWGNSHFQSHFFKTEEEALKYQKEYNDEYNNELKVPDWYIIAKAPREL